jgi:hypothetical protein
LNTKKKRKAIAQVRIRPLLWAALASTKSIIAQEYETSRTTAESAVTNAPDVNNLGNLPFNTEADRVWITYIGFDKVCFNTSYFSSREIAYPFHGNGEVEGARRIDMSRPFFLRVNKTVWQPTGINIRKDLDCLTGNSCWGGEIFAFAQMSNYECEFVSIADNSVISSTGIKTLQAPKTDAVSPPPLSPSVQHSGCSNSPTTILKISIETAEAKLTEERARQEHERMYQKMNINATCKEVDRLVSDIASLDENNDRLHQKVQQSNLHAKQADKTIASLTEELHLLEKLAEDELSQWKSAKSAWQSGKGHT